MEYLFYNLQSERKVEGKLMQRERTFADFMGLNTNGITFFHSLKEQNIDYIQFSDFVFCDVYPLN